jgi:hypothetical protein
VNRDKTEKEKMVVQDEGLPGSDMASTKNCSSTETGLGCSPLSSVLAESSTL